MRRRGRGEGNKIDPARRLHLAHTILRPAEQGPDVTFRVQSVLELRGEVVGLCLVSSDLDHFPAAFGHEPPMERYIGGRNGKDIAFDSNFFAKGDSQGSGLVLANWWENDNQRFGRGPLTAFQVGRRAVVAS